MRWSTSSYREELFLYLLLLLSLLLARSLGFFNLSPFVLVLPALLGRVRVELKNPYNLSALALIPFVMRPPLLYSFAQALLEELFFRAYMMRRLSNLRVSVMFALAHLILRTDLLSLLTLLPSLLLGWVYMRTGSVILAGVLHFFFNLLWILLAPFLHRPDEFLQGGYAPQDLLLTVLPHGGKTLP